VAVPSLGALALVPGFLAPMRESGSMIPQLFIGSMIRRLPVRKWFWALGGVGQCLCMVRIGCLPG